MPRPTLIGLIGEKEVGKDTVGGILTADYGYERRAFGDSLKGEVRDCLNSGQFPRAEPLNIPADITYALAVYRNDGAAAFDKPITPVMRRLLQWWGTEFRRSFDADYWVKLVAVDLPEVAVVTDVRFDNEIAFIRDNGGALIKINRRKSDSSIGPAVIETHVSESIAKSDSVECDLVLDNNGTIDDLRALIAKAFGASTTAPVEPPAPAPVAPPPSQPNEAKATPVPEPVPVAPVVEVPAPTVPSTDSAQAPAPVAPPEPEKVP